MRYPTLPLVITLATGPLAAQQSPAPAPGEQEMLQEPVPTPASLGLFVYPKEGQLKPQQEQDEIECYRWAREQTQIDPMATDRPPQQQAKQGPDGSAVKGAARGAAVGAAIGAIAGDTGEGAAIGATAGAVRGRRQSRRARKEAAKQAEQQAETQEQGAKQTFNNAWGACLEGRDYSVK